MMIGRRNDMRCKRCGKAKRTSKFFSDDQICGQCRIGDEDYAAKKSARAKKQTVNC